MAPTAAFSGFGQVLLELVETERSYATCLSQLLRAYRPALQPLAKLLEIRHTARQEIVLDRVAIANHHGAAVAMRAYRR